MSDKAVPPEQRRMENDLVALEIFDPTIHTTRFVHEILTNPSFLAYIPFPKITTETDFLTFYNQTFTPPSSERIYAVYNKHPRFPITSKTNNHNENDQNHNYAGIAAYSTASLKNSTIELGCILFPPFHKSHVAVNAIGLLLLWSLDPPKLGGLGLRRVEWKAHSLNLPSRKAAERWGFELEGIAKWERHFPAGEFSLSVEDLEKRNGREEEMDGRHTAIYAMCWDEWDVKRPKLVSLMEWREGLDG